MASSNLTVPTEVSPEVSVQISKGPLLHRVVLESPLLYPLIPNQTDS
jgi:hypothetical protein